MPTEFMNRVAVVIPAAGKAAFNAELQVRGWGTDNFPVALVPIAGDDDAETTHWLGCGQLTDVQLGNLATLCESYPNIKYIVLDELTREVIGGNISGWEELEGQVPSIEQMAALQNLKRRVVALV
jgi:hypothetical protein